MDDVLVDPSLRGMGVGTELVDAIIETARAERCYKLIAMSRDSRPEIDELYRRRGFVERGKEFRIDF
jgi:GNAT superfamily N-acetyltransferase